MDPTETPIAAADLSDRDPTRRPAIQPHGCLLLCALPSWTVRAVSANAGHFLGRDVDGLLDVTLDAVLPAKTLHDLRNVLQAAMVSGGAERLLDRPIDGGPERYDFTVHMTASEAVVEIVPCKGAEALATDPVTLVKSMVSRLKRAPTLERFLHLAAHQVRAVTGFDRVMVYEFLPDGSGEVKAEALRSGLPPSLGLRYPASDVPDRARALYRQQWLRLIPDLNSVPVPLLTRPGSTHAADLSLAALCDVPPAHLEHLRDMGAAAALTISVMAGDALWGLIVCHHASPRRIASSTCAAIELFGQIVSLQIEAKERARDVSLEADLRQEHDRLIAAMSAESSILDDPGRYGELVTRMIPCDGYGMGSRDGFIGVGSTPPAEAMPDLLRHLDAVSAGQPYATNALSRELPSAADYAAAASGVLSIPLSPGRRESLLLFRRESIQTVTWGGGATQPPTADLGESGVAPRSSFEGRRETLHGQSTPWREAELRIAATLRASLLDLLLRRAEQDSQAARTAAGARP